MTMAAKTREAPDPQDILFSAKAVLRHLAGNFGWRMSRMQLWRLARRDRDRLPVALRLKDRRGTIVASRRRIDAWVRRNLPVSDAREPVTA